MTKNVNTSRTAAIHSACDRARVAQVVTRVWPIVQGVLRRLLGAQDPEFEDVLQSALAKCPSDSRAQSSRSGSMPGQPIMAASSWRET